LTKVIKYIILIYPSFFSLSAGGIMGLDFEFPDMLELAKGLEKGGDLETARLIREKVTNPQWCDTAYAVVAESYAGAGKFSQAYDVASKIRDPKKRACVEAAIAKRKPSWIRILLRWLKQRLFTSCQKTT
jgi:hypothetical protein